MSLHGKPAVSKSMPTSLGPLKCLSTTSGGYSQTGNKDLHHTIFVPWAALTLGRASHTVRNGKNQILAAEKLPVQVQIINIDTSRFRKFRGKSLGKMRKPSMQ